MLKPSCVSCCRELRCKENGVVLVHYIDNNKTKGIDAWAFGDLYECPTCFKQVIMGLGSPIVNKDLPLESAGYKIYEIRR